MSRTRLPKLRVSHVLCYGAAQRVLTKTSQLKQCDKIYTSVSFINLVQTALFECLSVSGSMSSPKLAPGIAKSLSKGVELRVRHLTHPPTSCDPLFSPPPGEQPELTHFQSHFLVASIKYREDKEDSTVDGRELLVFAIEVLVYTTARLTTVFVSKADSAGFLYLLDLPPKSTSIIRTLSTEFLTYLVRAHQRPGVRLVLSLFARAQAWYLFRGSRENPQKHVLDDRGLIKWWCRVFDPILRMFEPEDQRQSKDGKNDTGAPEGAGEDKTAEEKTKASATAYLIVPGCEKPEMRTLFPSTFKLDDNQRHPRWVNAYPLHQLCAFPSAPPRCLVPRFPDDPKTRFLIELDDEIPEGSDTGQWKSIKTLDHFWEMLSHRQECSAGRMVGFLWMVVNPPGVLNSDDMGTEVVPNSSAGEHGAEKGQITADKQKEDNEQQLEMKQGDGHEEIKRENNQKGVKNVAPEAEDQCQPSPAGIDDKTILLSHDDYSTVTDALGDFEFADKETALESTKSWLDKLTSIFSHGDVIVGQFEPVGEELASQSSASSNPAPNVLKVRKRKKRDEPDPERTVAETNSETIVNGSTGPAKNGSTTATVTATATNSTAVTREDIAAGTTVNVLSAELVRKKRKVNGSGN